tara:strand:+ start:1190 stop:1909 length:720 start_codon:yes stop_codon:yes gene_type:complete
MKKINEVYETKNYSQFKYIDGNRLIKKTHTKKILNSMKKNRLFSPMIVNENMEIIDGQHRFQAQEILGVSVPFIIKKGYGKKETQILNENSKNWSLDDRLHTFCNDRIEDYLIFREFKEKYKFANRECMNLLSGTRNNSFDDVFRAGEFKIKDYNGAISKSVKITDIAKYFKYYRTRYFVNAMQVCFDNEDYNHNKFLRKLDYQSTRLVKCVNVRAYLELIEKIHDYHDYESTKKLRLF